MLDFGRYIMMHGKALAIGLTFLSGIVMAQSIPSAPPPSTYDLPESLPTSPVSSEEFERLIGLHSLPVPESNAETNHPQSAGAPILQKLPGPDDSGPGVVRQVTEFLGGTALPQPAVESSFPNANSFPGGNHAVYNPS